MKVIHTADLHLGITRHGGEKRAARFRAVWRNIVRYAVGEKPDLFVFAGDAFDTPRVREADLEAFARGLAVLQRHMPVVVVAGNPTHDGDWIEALGELAPGFWPNLHVFTEPGSETLRDLSGKPLARVSCLPASDRRWLAAQNPELSRGEQVDRLSSYLDDIVRGFATWQGSSPHIFVGHVAVRGAEQGRNQVAGFFGEPVLSEEVLQPFDLVCLGHIHKAQALRHGYYSGSPLQNNFGEEGYETGIMVYDLANVHAKRVPTKGPEHLTIDIPAARVLAGDLDGYDVKDAIIRLRIRGSREEIATLDLPEVADRIRDRGAFWLAEVTPIVEETVRGRAEDITEEDDVFDLTERWLRDRGFEEAEIENALKEARAIVEEVSP